MATRKASSGMKILDSQNAESAVSRSLAVLEALAAASEPMRLSAIALRLGMQKSTVHRILSTLSQLGYAEQVEATSCYHATLKLWELGVGIAAVHPVKRAASAFLQTLHRATGETVSLMILSGDDVLYLDKIVSPRPIRFTTRIGSRVPAPLTAGGKAMLAHAPDARAIARRVAPRIKDKRRVEIEALMRELEKVRAQGYATSSFSPGVISFAAPVMAREGQAAAALSVSAPTERVNGRKRGEIIEEVMTACTNLAERLGHL
jgi:IclR family acetate operon transcriptional repressor